MTEKLFVKFHAEIVNGICPSCDQLTMLVGITRDQYRCLSCDEYLKQHINGSISYIPHITKTTLQSKVDEYFGYGKES